MYVNINKTGKNKHIRKNTNTRHTVFGKVARGDNMTVVYKQILSRKYAIFKNLSIFKKYFHMVTPFTYSHKYTHPENKRNG